MVVERTYFMNRPIDSAHLDLCHGFSEVPTPSTGKDRGWASRHYGRDTLTRRRSSLRAKKDLAGASPVIRADGMAGFTGSLAVFLQLPSMSVNKVEAAITKPTHTKNATIIICMLKLLYSLPENERSVAVSRPLQAS